jgi:hypothetical protein
MAILPESLFLPKGWTAVGVAVAVFMTAAKSEAFSSDEPPSLPSRVSGRTWEEVSGSRAQKAQPHLNQLVLEEMKRMPSDGGYATIAKALEALRSNVGAGSDGVLAVDAARATGCTGSLRDLSLP